MIAANCRKVFFFIIFIPAAKTISSAANVVQPFYAVNRINRKTSARDCGEFYELIEPKLLKTEKKRSGNGENEKTEALEKIFTIRQDSIEGAPLIAQNGVPKITGLHTRGRVRRGRG